MRVGDVLDIHVLDLVALTAIKEAVGRERDKAVLPIYRRPLEQREPAGD